MFKFSIQGKARLRFYRYRCPKCNMAQFATAYNAEALCRCGVQLPDVVKMKKSETSRVGYYRAKAYPIAT